jgi:outer membrane protein TolC
VATEARGRAAQLVELTGHFADSGKGTKADADRARAEQALRDVELARSREAYDVARARLAQVLRLDPTLKLVPTEEFVAPVELTAAELPVAELVARGLSSRPELAEHRHLVCAAVERLRRERLAPLVPSLLVGTSFGGFGAGLGGNINDYGDRFDFDAVAYWELRNLGAGDRAARGVAQSQLNQARVRQLAMLDLVAREVVEAHAMVTSRRTQIDAARQAVAAAQDSYRRNVDRIHGGEGLPIETLQSLQAWATAEREYVRAVIDFNAAQFRLQRAMGFPIDSSIPNN